MAWISKLLLFDISLKLSNSTQIAKVNQTVNNINYNIKYTY